MKKRIDAHILLKNKAKVLLENLLSTRKALTSFQWRQFVPIKSWRPRLPFEKYRDFIKSQGLLSRELQRECDSASIKLDGLDKSFVLALKQYSYKLELAFKSLQDVADNREWRDDSDPQFTLKGFRLSIQAHQKTVDELFLEAKKLNDIWVKMPPIPKQTTGND